MPGRLPDNAASALRGALTSPWPELRAAAELIIQSAIRREITLGAAADSLGISRWSLAGLRKLLESHGKKKSA